MDLFYTPAPQHPFDPTPDTPFCKFIDSVPTHGRKRLQVFLPQLDLTHGIFTTQLDLTQVFLPQLDLTHV
jgi:hypothetical protein